MPPGTLQDPQKFPPEFFSCEASLSPMCPRLSSMGTASYLLLVDIPFYYQNWVSGVNVVEGKSFDFWASVREISECGKITRSYADWSPHMTWMFLYFTICCWAREVKNALFCFPSREKLHTVVTKGAINIFDAL